MDAEAVERDVDGVEGIALSAGALAPNPAVPRSCARGVVNIGLSSQPEPADAPIGGGCDGVRFTDPDPAPRKEG